LEHLEKVGWTPGLEPAGEGLVAARVVIEQKGLYTVVTSTGERSAVPAGRMTHEAAGKDALPVVGDLVGVRFEDASGQGRIEEILPRKSLLRRGAAGTGNEAQPLAANVDTAFLVASVEGEFNLNRIERYLAMLWDSGATPVLLLNKVDVVEDAGPYEAAAAGLGVETHLISGQTGEGTEVLAPYLSPGRTVCLLGSSGVGKSTLLNRLAGSQEAATGGVREGDGKGRHTTTGRQLYRLPSGACVIDTPGMRELRMWDAGGLEKTFGDIEEAARECRFHDCGHDSEPGCAVLERIDARRIESWRKLLREIEFQATKKDAGARQDTKRRWKSITKMVRQKKRLEGD